MSNTMTIRAGTAPSTAVARHAGEEVLSDVEELAEDMVARWRQGERPLVEEYLSNRPELNDQPEAALELIAEELALRAEHGEPINAEEFAARFPRWRARVQVLLDCQRILGARPGAPIFPLPGERIGDFEIQSVLGRGANAQVYLATQPGLADRAVVLKLGPAGSREHLSLARLQHTHIVPLYSAHDFPDRGLHGLCMPYFGGATLAAILTDVTTSPPANFRGRDLPAIVGRRDPSPPAVPARSATAAFLEHASITEAVCWIGACLADALQYAHDRGLVHLDLKPSNVLIAADGTPMLLDFHLAHPPLVAGEPAPTRLGGTPGYMPPEQVAAMRAVASNGPIAETVDGHADVFALGTLLGQCLRAFTGQEDPKSIGLFDILQRATAADAAKRYATAGELATDLRRHLSDLPLKGVSNRSLAERWRKWRRRRPFAIPLVLTLGALVMMGIGLVIRGARQVEQAQAALYAGEQRLAEKRYREAEELFRGGEVLIEGVPFQESLRQRLRDARRSADRGQVMSDLHSLCERVRLLYAAEGVPPQQLQAVAAQCRTLWDRREDIARELRTGSEGEETSWQTDLLDLGILTAYFETQTAPADLMRTTRLRGLETLDQAEQLLGPSAVLDRERARHAAALGLQSEADAADRRSNSRRPRTAWEHLVIGRSALGAGDVAGALAALDRSLDLEPDSIWANYYKGICCLRLDRPTEAVAAFSACVALSPQSAWCFHNRGLAFARAGQADQALADVNRALALEPQLAAAYLARAAIHERAGRIAEAKSDREQARKLGISVHPQAPK
jgi:tetratricopeptide (TPR) repeat protein